MHNCTLQVYYNCNLHLWMAISIIINNIPSPPLSNFLLTLSKKSFNKFNPHVTFVLRD